MNAKLPATKAATPLNQTGNTIPFSVTTQPAMIRVI